MGDVDHHHEVATLEFGVREDLHTCIACLTCRYVSQGLLYALGLYTLGLCTCLSMLWLHT